MFATRTGRRSACLLPLTLALVGADRAGADPLDPRFRLETSSVQSGQSWQINREVVLGFNEALDFSTVNLNTVRIVEVATGLPAVGEFSLRSPAELVFQPSCPSQEDFSDAGFEPGSTYNLFVPDATNAALFLRSASGKPLAEGILVTFFTPSSSNPADLFFDEVPGPPQLLVQPTTTDGSWLSTGAGEERFFQLGGGGLATLPGFLAPVNLYSDLDTRVRVHLRFDQTLLPTAANLGQGRLRIEYEDGDQWHPLPTEAQLQQSCGGGGSTVVLSARGNFPQGRELRAHVGAGLQDITGDGTLLDEDRLRFETRVYEGAAFQPVDHADAWQEDFGTASPALSSLEDDEALLVGVRASWGGGRLEAADGFAGSGGPGGDFDYHVPPGTVVLIDTVTSVIVGGPGGVPTTTQLVVGGIMDVRNLYVPEDAKLLFVGPNPATILASGEVRIDGQVGVDGFAAPPVFTLNTPDQPEQGAAGNCGGGAGGVGSWMTTQVTQRGGPGQGAFGVPGGGGEGGESGWSDSNSQNGAVRRAAGGGGGRFGHDQRVRVDGVAICADQGIYGLDVESGFPGQDTANSSQGAHFPYGGHAGPSPFGATTSVRDDFLGRALFGFRGSNPRLGRGELDSVGAGAGGGAGGDSTYSPTGVYPPPVLINNHQDKGAGGGGGAGAISIFALGDVVFGPHGRLSSVGGHGSSGENTAGINHIGGGSGGGSGGHVIVHTAGLLDLSQVATDSIAIDARGGQGGEGADGVGGAFIQESAVVDDAKHVGANNGVDNPWVHVPTPCANLLQGNQVVRAAGGDGGPGVVQLHVSKLLGPSSEHAIRYPGSGEEAELAAAVRPAPVGFDLSTGEWRHHLLPEVGSLSQAQSRWIALGFPQAAPDGGPAETLGMLFAGTDAEGYVLAPGGAVPALRAILEPEAPVEAPGLPNLAGDRRLHLDSAGLSAADRIYAANPGLLRGFELVVGGTAHAVVAASIGLHSGFEVLTVEVDAAGPPIATSGKASLRPRFLRAFDGDQPDLLPAGASIRVELQAAGATPEGEPDPAAVYPAPGQWATDPAELSEHPESGSFRFLRFRVSFQLGKGANPPALGSLVLPWRF